MHRRWCSLPLPRITDDHYDHDDINHTRIKSTIKGSKLHANGDLNQMLRFNATQMFIKTFDSVAQHYPFDYALLSEAVIHNNTTVFRHLCKHPKMLQYYFNITGPRKLPKDNMALLPIAVDTGNEHVVRLLLHHLNIVDHSLEDFKKFKRPGVSVGILRVLHEEFNCLFRFKILWQKALTHSVKCNMIDSVQYIIDNMPWPEPYPSAYDQLMYTCLDRCAKACNIDMLQLLYKSHSIGQFIKDSKLRLITHAIDYGHQSFVDHLTQIVGLGTKSIFYITPMSAIRNDDIVGAESLQGMQKYDVSVSERLFRRMSRAMAEYLVSPQSKIRLDSNSLINMSEAVGKPGSHITADLVIQFIANHTSPNDTFMEEVMLSAAGYSAEVLRHIVLRFPFYFENEHLIKALDHGCQETIVYIIQTMKLNPNADDKYKLEKSALRYLSAGSLEIITIMLDRIKFVRTNTHIFLYAMMNEDPKVFEHVINLCTLDQLDNSILELIINQSFQCNKPNNLKLLQDRFGHEHIQPIIPSLKLLHHMAELNAYHSLEHHFNTSSTFTNMPITHRLRIIYSTMNAGYKHGMTRVIKLCADLIKSINHSFNQLKQVDNVCTVTCSRQVETAVHFVLGDMKLGMLIMEQVGVVHKSLGVEAKHVIKGAQLMDRHCLNDYIKYGATEWFLKAYSPSLFSNTYLCNTTLLETALERCEPRVVNVLLANPIMTVRDIPKLNMRFISKVSSCSHPDWEMMFDQYILITCQGDTLEFEDDAGVLSCVQHPSFLRKLIECDVKLKTIGKSSYELDNIAQGWLTKPWAMDMFLLLIQHSLISPDLHYNLYIMAIDHGVTSIFNYYSEKALVGLLNKSIGSKAAMDIMEHCCIHGRLEYLVSVLPMINERFPINHTSSFSVVSSALVGGHMDIVNFILDNLSSSSSSTKDGMHLVNKIHYNIMSVELIDRLMAHPHITCKLANVMGAAVRFGNKPVIRKMMDLHSNKIVCTDYRYALDMAMRVLRLEHYKLSEEVFLEITNNIQKGKTYMPSLILSKLLGIASKKSLAAIKMVMDYYSRIGIDEINKLGISNFSSYISNSIHRDDIESVEYLIKLAKVETNDQYYQLIEFGPLSNASILSHCYDRGYISVDDKSEALLQMVDNACCQGYLDIIKVVHQRCITPAQLLRHLPSYLAIIKASLSNHHMMLSYLFEGDQVDGVSSFERAQVKFNMIRLLHTVRHHAYGPGNLKIIAMCDRLLSRALSLPRSPSPIEQYVGVKRTLETDEPAISPPHKSSKHSHKL
ncbi:hypothetical protein SAMD00019534_101070 [Acytostelium subglobosum LB1]|uniref:hypothetical protein n=1 Tax=Acytostelium subglobosum LB1 TaxID=1410327 RepID=UPI000644B329|nr:hypothetical protein SAMD00019534_101070 [Acytostelium subglobosum LB1]GAM26932.1 hypothetical protein SAMD00019534_101070 [Acytostelium subglobosum LB1]|eukprot:XP_012750200.1 hypothetical protein SAMD00019534_101070 [Acytostelium subglobosum LB1]